MYEVVQRPWGTYTILDEGPTYKVKRIEVFPGSRLSYQKHFRRSEHWMTVAGNARVVLNDHEIILEPGGTIDIPTGASHRVENPGTTLLVFIEIQRGEYFGEDDIVRIQDDYGRA